MPYKTPPTEYLRDWAVDGRIGKLSIPKQREGYNEGEAPGASHLNYAYNRVGNWNEVTGRATAAKMAFRNIEYYSGSETWGPTAVPAAAVHIDYFALADRWYLSSIDTSGNVWVQDSATGEPDAWQNQKFIANVGAGSTGDFTKIATDGTVCAIGVDNGVWARCWRSPSLGALGMVDYSQIGLLVEASDLTYDATNGLWICCGRTSTKGTIYTSPDLTTWTVRYTAAVDTDMYTLATDEAGNSVASGATVTVTSSNGTTWTPATGTDCPVANNIAWAPSLNLFVARENATGDLWTSTDGDDWSDQNFVNSVPPLWNMVHCPDFFLLWSSKTTSTNGDDYSSVYAFHTEATDEDHYNYQTLGHSWEACIPFLSAANGIYRGGQGKIIYPSYDVAKGSDFVIAIARYGAAEEA